MRGTMHTLLSHCYAPFVVTPAPPLQREVTAKGHFLLPYTPPHLHMHTCVGLALTSMFTLVLRCYYVVIFAKCVRLFPCGRLRTCGIYRTMTAILLRRERGRNSAEMYAVLVVTPPPPPPPPLQREVTFQKGGRNDMRVRYMHVQGCGDAGINLLNCASILRKYNIINFSVYVREGSDLSMRNSSPSCQNIYLNLLVDSAQPSSLSACH